MYVDPTSTIAGKPALEIRDFLRRSEAWSWGRLYLAQAFRVSDFQARELISGLVEEGLVEPDPSSPEYWRTTAKGRTLALASAAKPLRRSTAERKLREFLERVEQVNRDERFVFQVAKVVVFGSILTTKERINDVDVAVLLEPKEADSERHRLLCQERTSEAVRQGRSFSSFLDQIFWPQREVLLHLKSKSRALSLHSFDDRVLNQTETKVIYELSRSASAAQGGRRVTETRSAGPGHK